MSCRTSRNVISNGRPLVWTSALLIRDDLCPQRTLLCPHDPDRLGRSLMWVPLMVFFPPQTALVLSLGFSPNIDVDNELLGPIPLHFLYMFSSLLKSLIFKIITLLNLGNFFPWRDNMNKEFGIFFSWGENMNQAS